MPTPSSVAAEDDAAHFPEHLSPGLRTLGPDIVSAWRDVTNANKLCTRCKNIPWNLFEFEESDFLNPVRRYSDSSSSSVRSFDKDITDNEELVRVVEVSKDGTSSDTFAGVERICRYETTFIPQSSANNSPTCEDTQTGAIPLGDPPVCNEQGCLPTYSEIYATKLDQELDISSLIIDEEYLHDSIESGRCFRSVETFGSINEGAVLPRTSSSEQVEHHAEPGVDSGLLGFGNEKASSAAHIHPHSMASTEDEDRGSFDLDDWVERNVYPLDSLATDSFEYFGHIFRPHIHPPDPMGPYIELWPKGSGPTLGNIRDAAHQGCHLCCLILSSFVVARSNLVFNTFLGANIATEVSEDDEITMLGRVFKSSANGAHHRYLWGQIRGRGRGVNGMHFRITVLSDETAGCYFPTKVPDITVAAPAESIAKWWLEDCLRNHVCPGNNIDHPLLPKRVIDLSRVGSKEEVFLFESNGMRAQYATLSYCWGHSRLLRTTTATYIEHCTSIPSNLLPRTFQDAVTMVIGLGLRFIWIDALCIIQDSEEDCQGELGSMADIYSNSTITIAAVGATSADSGCLVSRNKLAMTDCEVAPDIVLSANLEGQEFVLDSGTIYSRAWCFQEIQLSPRILLCGLKELYFECSCGVYREGHPTELLSDFTNGMSDADSETRSCRAKRRFVDISADLDPSHIYDIWHQCINEYTQVKLTYQKDKFDAISGLASRFPSLFNEHADRPTTQDYLAGIWRSNLLTGLLRESTFSDPVHRQPIPFRAPSWSWASTDANTPWFRKTKDFCCEILEVSVNPVSELNPYGQVRSGKITIFGAVRSLPGRVIYLDDKYQSSDDHSTRLQWAVDWDYNASRDVGCICLAITLSDALVLSPVRKPGATRGIYQRVGITNNDFGIPSLFDGLEVGYSLGPPYDVEELELRNAEWQLDVVTII